MKIITVKQPWASLIVEGVKDIENRTWSTKFRGRVLIHASAAWNKSNAKICISNKHVKEALESLDMIHRYDDEGVGYKGYSFSGLETGAIIGSVEIVDCVINYQSIWAEHTAKKKTKKNKAGVIFVDEIEVPVFNWVLANPVKFPEPIPAKGKLSFWDYPNILAEPEEKDGELFCHCQLSVKEENQVMRMPGYHSCRYCGGKWYK